MTARAPGVDATASSWEFETTRRIRPYVTFFGDSIGEALHRLSAGSRNVLFCVDDGFRLHGSVSLQQIVDWLGRQDWPDLRTPIERVVEQPVNEDPTLTSWPPRAECAPILDHGGRLIEVALRNRRVLRIGERLIGADCETYVIAEIGINHNGSVALAKRMAELARDAGADCVKFQMRAMKSLYVNGGDPDDSSQDVGSQYVLEVLARSQLSREEMLDVFAHCRALGIEPLCTPWDFDSVRALEAGGLAAFKVASADLTNHELIKQIAAGGRPLLVSTGMSTEPEIVDTVSVLERCDTPFALLHCVSTYPAPAKDLNLRYIERLRELGRCPVGYSGHERGFDAAVTAVACGASIVEKHFTVDRSLPGNDHKISLLPDEFRSMVGAIRKTEVCLGQGSPRRMGQGERMNRVNLAKSLVAACDIEAGETIDPQMVSIKSPGKGLQPNFLQALIGRKAPRRLPEGEFFYESDLRDDPAVPRAYAFRRPWGIPVRYHDHADLVGRSNMDFLEFHLSYKDLDISVEKVVTERYDVGLAVHAPDILAGDLILDPASNDPKTLAACDEALRRCAEVSRQLAGRFNGGGAPVLIVSAGGCSRNQPLGSSERARRYEQLVERLDRLCLRGVEVVFQTMPPFPWYFGGQRFANLFVDPEECSRFCDEYGQRLCLDISHAKLACNYRGRKFGDYLRILAPHASHLHLVDAAGIDGEGLQIDEGEIDFRAAAEILDDQAPRVGFIPEVWHGHRNGGEGFWVALERLERHFNYQRKE